MELIISTRISHVAEERKAWRKNNPHGMGLTRKVVIFQLHSISERTKCRFPQGFFHPNVYPSGNVCLSILNEVSGWRPEANPSQLQDLLDQPNPADPAQAGGYHHYIQEKEDYRKRAKQQAKHTLPSSEVFLVKPLWRAC
ncbi:hypothetical protein ACHQM5_027183 [Ranunculus cassubicifolius]